MSAILLDVSSNGVVVIIRPISRGVQTDLFPRKKAILDLVTKVEELWERIVVGRSLKYAPHVVRVGNDGLRVGVVWVSSFDGSAQDLVPEELANLCDRAGLDQKGVVRKSGDVHVCEQMGVDGAAVVVAWEDGVESGDAVLVGRLDAAKICRVVATRGVVAGGGDTAVIEVSP